MSVEDGYECGDTMRWSESTGLESSGGSSVDRRLDCERLSDHGRRGI